MPVKLVFMSENLRMFTRAIYLLDAVVQRVPADAWDNTSCCEGWTARQTAGHAAWFLKNTASLASGGSGIAEQAEAEVLGSDPAAEMRNVVSHIAVAFDQKGVLERVAATPFGEMPIDNFIGIVWIDPMTHAWDVADAAGIDHGIDNDTATAAMAVLQPLSDNLRGPGLFSEKVDVSTDDPVSTYIAFTGRKSVRS